jgi:hypothetical protein
MCTKYLIRKSHGMNLLARGHLDEDGNIISKLI